MNLHLTKVITLVGALLIAFAAGGAATRMFNVDISWQGVSEPQEVSPDTSQTKQPGAHPTIILKQDNYGQGSVESSTSKREADPYVKCFSDEKCGGGFITVRESECNNRKCCEYSPGKWKNMSESECSKSQIASYGQLHSNQGEPEILQNPPLTSQQMIPTESPNLAARCASEKAVTISRVKGGLLKKIKSMETPDFHPEEIYAKQVYLNSIKAIYDNAVRKAEQLGTELEHYCLTHNGNIEGFQMPEYYE